MKKEKSCGGVVFTREDGIIKYVIIKQTNGICCFPKGHMESGETEEETAIREIKEETGLDVTLVGGFRECDNYSFSLDNGEKITKDVVYFLGELSAGTPMQQEGELEEIYLLPYEEAYEKLQFERSKEVLTLADKFLRGKR